jgi:hypothetical protein
MNETPTLQDLQARFQQLELRLADTGASAATQPWDRDMVLILSISCLAFGLVVISLMAYLSLKRRASTLVLRSFSVPLIIVAAVFLVVAGFGERQIAPVIGLLGTIAGYLLGSERGIIERERSTPASKANDAAEKD